MIPHEIAPEILRQYDIRGTVGQNLAPEDAYAIGRVFAQVVRQRTQKHTAQCRVAVGRDGRLSSPELSAQVIQGLSDDGVTAIEIPTGPTPMLYFADRHLGTDGAIMVTGSHNPADMNGFKMVMHHRPFFGEDIQLLGQLARQSSTQNAHKAQPCSEDCRLAYVERLCEEMVFWPEGFAPKLAWDAGNGATGEVLEMLLKRLPGEHHALFTEIDGRFPHHHPDPTIPANLQDLLHTVREKGCDFGIAFDGDGDRLGVIDASGEILWGDRMLMILAEQVLQSHPGATVIADVKASGLLFEHVTALGGVADMYKTGHALIKTRMAETGAPLAGEMSGHLFFADRYYGFDDALYAALRLIGALASRKQSLSEAQASFPLLVATPEVRVPCPEADKTRVIAETRALLDAEGLRYNAIDGMRVETAGGWWLMRASNTEAILVLRAEAENVAALEALWQMAMGYIARAGLQPVSYT